MAGIRPRIEVVGAKQLRREMKQLGEDMAQLTEVNRQAAEPVASTARSLVPVLSGRLGNTIAVKATRTRALVQAGGRLVPYAGPIHFGWPAHNIAPQPFLYDALDKRADDVQRAYADHVERLVHKFDREAP